jgi:hypothetical protein
MKKIFIVAALLIAFGTILTSCGSSRKTGCPGTEGIVH